MMFSLWLWPEGKERITVAKRDSPLTVISLNYHSNNCKINTDGRAWGGGGGAFQECASPLKNFGADLARFSGWEGFICNLISSLDSTTYLFNSPKEGQARVTPWQRLQDPVILFSCRHFLLMLFIVLGT